MISVSFFCLWELIGRSTESTKRMLMPLRAVDEGAGGFIFDLLGLSH
jgi:hypothetical protein